MIAFITCCYTQEPIYYAKIKQESEKACNLNVGGGCYNLENLYDNGYCVKQDYHQAKTYYEKAAQLRDKLKEYQKYVLTDG
jgi:TPR repeat protein